ncbi:MAG: Hpt domain-containing protein, partial [Wenzhouxiangellaceae bacterium]|nr:Hpt domain-containing protein [Wenzhouxiangellaceae bacterium]
MVNSSAAARAQGVQWTRPHLQLLCETIRQALEAWAGESDGKAPDMDEARSAAQQLSATLAALQVAGAARLAAAMSAALRALDEPDEEPATVLLEAVAVLPAYLERIETGAPDVPQVLDELVARLHEIAGAPEASESIADRPGVDRLDPGRGSGGDVDVPAVRRGFQRALRDWLKNPSDVDEIEAIGARLQDHEHASLRRLGRVLEAGMQALEGGQLQAGPGIQKSLAAVDNALGKWIEDEPSAADEATHAWLAEFQGARSGCESLDAIREDVEDAPEIDEAVVEHARSVLAGRNRELFTAMAEAARGELNQAKDALNALLMGQDTEGGDIEAQARLLTSVAESFSMLGLNRLKARVEKQATRLGELTGDPESPVLLDVARELLLVESELDESVLFLGEAPETSLLEGEGDRLPKAEHRRVMRQVLHEALDDLSQAKHLLDQLHRGQGEDDNARQAMEVLERVTGVLRMSGLPEVGELLEASARCVEAEWVEGEDSGMSVESRDQRRDVLAEALIVAEFYLDSLSRHDDRGLGWLETARSNLRRLGVLEPDEATAPEPAEEPQRPEPAESEGPEDEDLPAFDEMGSVGESPSEAERPAAVDGSEERRAAEQQPEEAGEESGKEESFPSFDEMETVEADGEEAAEPTARSDEEPDWDADALDFDLSEPGAGAEDEPEAAAPVESGEEDAGEAFSFDELSEEETPEKSASEEGAEPERFEGEDLAAEGAGFEMPGPDDEEDVAESLEAEEESEPEPEPEPEPAGTSALAGDDFDLLSIFLEEFDEELESLREHFPKWRAEPSDEQLLTTIRRSFHTLKGSGRMAGADRVGEFAWTVEQILNQTIDGQHRAEDVLDPVEAAIGALPSLRAELEGEEGEMSADEIDRVADRVRSIGEEEELPELEGVDPTLVQLMIREVSDHLESIDGWINRSRQQGWAEPVDRDLIRAVHTIKGTLRLAPIGNEAESMQLIEEYLQELEDTDAEPDESAVTLVEDMRTMLGKRLDRLRGEAVSTQHFETDHLAAEAKSLIAALHRRRSDETEDLKTRDAEIAAAESAYGTEAEEAEAEEAEAEEAEAEEAEAEEAEAEETEAEEAEAEEAEAEEAEAEEAEAEEAEA